MYSPELFHTCFSSGWPNIVQTPLKASPHPPLQAQKYVEKVQGDVQTARREKEEVSAQTTIPTLAPYKPTRTLVQELGIGI
jgi:hypothetical protein